MKKNIPLIGLALALGVNPLAAQFWKPAAEAPGEPACAAWKTSAPPGKISAPQSAGSTDVDVTWYGLDLNVASSLSGRVTLRATSLVDTLSVVLLDLTSAMIVDSVIVGGRSIPPLRYPAALGIVLDRTYHDGETVEATIVYHGVPPTTGLGSFVISSHNGSPWIWSLSEPYGARDWWPCKDQPEDKADSVDIHITADAAFKVGSNGRLASIVTNGDGTATTTWLERYPIATYLVSIAVTNYAEFSNWYHYSPSDSLQILNYVLPEHLADALANLPRTVDMLRIFSATFGPYPFLREKYGHAEFGFGGAMEHQTMTSTTTFEENTIAHELTHQWFGDLITCATWQDLWLNEGFASYGEAIYREATYGEDDYRATMAAFLNSAASADGSLFVQDTTSVKNLFAYNRVYAKGASVLHMLRHVLGDSVFFRCLRAYVADPAIRYGAARTADFRRVCETVSGQSLGYFFDEWVFGEKYPIYRPSWSVEQEGNGYRLTLTLHQTTLTLNPLFFTMPLDIRMTGSGLDTTLTLLHLFDGQEFSFRLPTKPEQLIVDPGNWILKDVVPSDVVIPRSAELLQNFPNPFNAGTRIDFSLPVREHVSLKIYSLLGERILTLLEGPMEPGPHSVNWDGRRENGSPAPSGPYFYRLTTESSSLGRKMLLLK